MNRFEKMILRFSKENSLLKRGDRVLVACSGGIDSVGLLHFMAANKEELGVDVAAVHVDHMLRGEESALDGVFVESLCQFYGIPFYGGRVPVPTIISEEGGNMQAVCRDGRYSFFSEVMKTGDYDLLATAHHAEDQLETVLMQLTKGVQPSGMPLQRGVEGGMLIRPFLPAMKAEIQSYLEEKDLRYREDPSNRSDAYMRNRFRHHIVPLVLAENAAAARNTVKLSSWLQEDEELLSSLALEQLKENMKFTSEGLPSIDVSVFLRMHPALQRRVITLLLNYIYDGETIPVEYNSALVDLLSRHLLSTDGTVSLDLPRGYQFVREYGKLTFVRNVPLQATTTQKVLPKGVWTPWGPDIVLFWTEKNDRYAGPFVDKDEILYFNLPDASLPLMVRNRTDGDRIQLSGMEQAKRLSRLFIDEKIGMRERNCLPILVTAEGEVCAVPGLRYGKAFSKNDIVQNKYIFCMRKL